MESSRPSLPTLSAATLYGIVDLGYVSAQAVEPVTRALCTGGVDLLQLRAKSLRMSEIEMLAGKMLPITREHGVPLIINDHPVIAANVECEGLHVGQDDDAVAQARAVVGPRCWIGKSTHSLTQAMAAQAEGADYIGFGPLYATGTKPDYTPVGLHDIAKVHRQVRIPIFCIGGINALRLPEILAAGARRVVVVSAFLSAPDIAAAVRAIKLRMGGMPNDE